MYRVVRLGHKWLAVEIESIEKDRKNIDAFLQEGSPVLLALDLADIEQTVDEDVTLVEEEEEDETT